MESRPQAGPLPRKRGEIGFRESLHVEEGSSGGGRSLSPSQDVDMPERHPADTALPETVTQPANVSSPTATERPATPTASSIQKHPKKTFLSFFNVRTILNKIKFAGIPLILYLRLIVQLSLMGATLAGWIILTNRLSKSDRSFDDASGDGGAATMSGSVTIFVHVTFAIGFIGQLIFLERCIFLMRAQRYLSKNPGAILPTHGRSLAVGTTTNNIGLGFAPWNRPALPTYAAALAQNGQGTGDVEDTAISVPPPPAYGNVRGSTLLLRGVLRDSQLRRSRVDDIDEDGESDRRSSRPVSYRSHDGESEDRRVQSHQASLQRLEEGSRSSEEHNADVAERRGGEQ